MAAPGPTLGAWRTRRKRPIAKSGGRIGPRRSWPNHARRNSCSSCGSEWINREVAEKLDAALSKAAAARRLQLVQESLAELRPRLQQQELERLLGLSGGYVSKVKHGKEDPSDYLVAAMLLLASRPEAVEQLKRSWDTGHLPLRLTNNHFSRVAVPVTGDLPVAA